MHCMPVALALPDSVPRPGIVCLLETSDPGGPDLNTSEALIANPDDTTEHYIRVVAREDGSFTRRGLLTLVAEKAAPAAVAGIGQLHADVVGIGEEDFPRLPACPDRPFDASALQRR